MTDILMALAEIETTTATEFFARDYSAAWTDATLRNFLDRHGVKYSVAKSTKPDRDNGIQYNLTECPLCRKGEGNPAVWLNNGVPCFHCFRGNSGCATKTFADLQAALQKPALHRISALELPLKYPAPRRSVLVGLLRRGDVANVIGGPKARKSFLMMQLALCVASGIPFLAWQTVQGRVLLIDNELRGDDLARRLIAMAKAMDLEWDEVAKQIDIITLRGTLADLHSIRDELCSIPLDTYALAIIDALYKALPKNTDENSNSDMTRAYVLLDETAEKQNCATAAVHHTSKGSQREKSVSDMGSGAGAQSRSADVHIVLREHEDKDTVVLQAIVRSQRPVEPVCLTFEYPIWRVAPNKDPNNVAVTNKKPTPTLDAFLETIPTEPSAKSDVLAWSKAKLMCSQDTIRVLLREAMDRGRVEIIKPKNKTCPHTIRRVV